MSMLGRKLTTTTPPKSSFIKSFKWCWYLRAVFPENVYTCPMRFSSHCCGYKLQFRISGFQDTSDIFDVQRSQELLYAYEFPARIFLVTFHCTMPDAHVVDIFMTQHPTSAANIPSFSIGFARFGESVEPVIFAVTRDFFVEVCHCGDRENSTSWGNIWEEDGRWDQVEQIKYRTFFR